MPNDSSSQNDFSLSSSIRESWGGPSTRNVWVIRQADEASGGLEAVGPDRTHPNLVLIATGPELPRRVSPVTRFQYWSDPINRSTFMLSRPSDESASSIPVKWLKSLWQNDTGWQAIGWQMVGTAKFNSVSWFVVPSFMTNPNLTESQTQACSSLAPKVIIVRDCSPSLVSERRLTTCSATYERWLPLSNTIRMQHNFSGLVGLNAVVWAVCKRMALLPLVHSVVGVDGWNTLATLLPMRQWLMCLPQYSLQLMMASALPWSASG